MVGGASPSLTFPPPSLRSESMKRIFVPVLFALIAAAPAMAQFGGMPSGFASYQSEEMQVAFYYPDGWYVVESDGNLAIVNREALIDQVNADQPDLQPGDTVVVVGVLPTMLLAMMGVPADDVSAIVNGMFENMISSSGGVENGEAQTHSYGDRAVASMLFDDSAEAFSGMIMVAHEQEEVIVFAVSLGFREDLLRERDDLARLVSTVEFTGDLSSLMGQ